MGVPIYSFCVHKTGVFGQKLATEWMGVPICSFCVHKTGYFAEKLATEWMGVPIRSFCVHKTGYFAEKLATEWMAGPIYSFCGTKMSRRSSIAMIPRLRGKYRGFFLVTVWAGSSEGLFSDGSRSHPKNSCWRTGNNPIPDPLPHPFLQLPKNKHI